MPVAIMAKSTRSGTLTCGSPDGPVRAVGRTWPGRFPAESLTSLPLPAIGMNRNSAFRCRQGRRPPWRIPTLLRTRSLQCFSVLIRRYHALGSDAVLPADASASMHLNGSVPGCGTLAARRAHPAALHGRDLECSQNVIFRRHEVRSSRWDHYRRRWSQAHRAQSGGDPSLLPQMLRLSKPCRLCELSGILARRANIMTPPSIHRRVTAAAAGWPSTPATADSGTPLADEGRPTGAKAAAPDLQPQHPAVRPEPQRGRRRGSETIPAAGELRNALLRMTQHRNRSIGGDVDPPAGPVRAELRQSGQPLRKVHRILPLWNGSPRQNRRASSWAPARQISQGMTKVGARLAWSPPRRRDARIMPARETVLSWQTFWNIACQGQTCHRWIELTLEGPATNKTKRSQPDAARSSGGGHRRRSMDGIARTQRAGPKPVNSADLSFTAERRRKSALPLAMASSSRDLSVLASGTQRPIGVSADLPSTRTDTGSTPRLNHNCSRPRIWWRRRRLQVGTIYRSRWRCLPHVEGRPRRTEEAVGDLAF